MGQMQVLFAWANLHKPQQEIEKINLILVSDVHDDNGYLLQLTKYKLVWKGDSHAYAIAWNMSK